jgi:Uma2 family endonuclease
MGTVTKAPPITVEQFRGFVPPPGFRDELINGKIVLSPEPKPRHQEVAKNLFRALDRLFRSTPFTVQQRTNAEMPAFNSMPSPDVFVIDKVRWKAAIVSDGYPQGSPQLAIEVVSPSNRKANIRKKVMLYLANGALAVWVVFPKKQMVEVWTGLEPQLEHTFGIGEQLPLPAELVTGVVPVGEVFDMDAD